MGEVVSFREEPSKYKPKKRFSNGIVISELRSYLPSILNGVEKWKAKEIARVRDSSHASDVEQASIALSNCVRSFILSGGQWSGRWPQMATEDHANFMVTDLYLFIMLELLPFREELFLKPIREGFERVLGSNSEPKFRFKRNIRTFHALCDFLAQLSEEEYRQAGRLHELRGVTF